MLIGSLLALTIAAIVILVLSQKPNPVNKISNELLDWNDEITSSQIQNISKKGQWNNTWVTEILMNSERRISNYEIFLNFY